MELKSAVDIFVVVGIVDSAALTASAVLTAAVVFVLLADLLSGSAQSTGFDQMIDALYPQSSPQSIVLHTRLAIVTLYNDLVFVLKDEKLIESSTDISAAIVNIDVM